MRRFTVAALTLFLFSCGASPLHAPPRPEAQEVRLDTVEGRRSAFLAAYRSLRAEDFARARSSFEALAASYPELEDYSLHFLAKSTARSGDAARAAEIWGRLADGHPKSVFLGASALERGRIWRDEGRLDAARIVLEKARKSGPEVRHEALFELAEIDASSGNLRAALDQFLAVRNAEPGATLGNRARNRMEELRRANPALQPSRPELEEELRLLVRERAFAEAVETANRLLAIAPPAGRAEFLRLRATAEQGMGNWETAVATLREVVRSYPDSPWTPECFFQSARLLWNHDRNTEAEEAFRDFRRRYPKDRNAAEALYAVARIEQSSGRYEHAIATYGKVARAYPRGRLAFESRWRVGWIRYQQEQWRAAGEEFRRLASSEPSGKRFEALYWQARSLEKAGRATAATKLYRQILEDSPASYYAALAERRLGVSNGATAIVEPVAPLAIGAAPEGVADDYHLVRARELQQIGLNPMAVKELHAFEAANFRDPPMTRFLLSAYRAADGYRDLVRLRRKKETSDPQTLYPLAYWPLVTRTTSGTAVDPLLVLSVMRQESMFDPEARSGANAIGLMQLIPSTASRMAAELNRSVATEDLYEPEVNISLGVAYLARLQGLYRGEPIRVLAAYNAGEDAVAKWDRARPAGDVDEWVENITYRETRDYVKRVLANQRKYRGIYGGSGDHQ